MPNETIYQEADHSHSSLLTVKDRYDLYLHFNDKVLFFWNWYTVGIIAVVGWMLSSEKKFSWSMKAIISFVFLTFIGMNISGLVRSYKLLMASRRDLLMSIKFGEEHEHEGRYHLHKVIQKQHYKYGLLTLVYAIGVIAVIAIVLGKGCLYDAVTS